MNLQPIKHITLVIRHRTMLGRREDARRAWEKQMRPANAANPGHLAYVYCMDDTDPDVQASMHRVGQRGGGVIPEEHLNGGRCRLAYGMHSMRNYLPWREAHTQEVDTQCAD